MKTVWKECFVTEDGEEFMHKNEAARHERRVQALGKVKALLLKAPAVKIGAQDGIGEECVEEFVGDLGAWILSDRVRADFRDIFGLVDGDVSKPS